MPTILLIDEDAALLASLAQQFEAAGFRALRANDLRLAELLAAEEQPDIALLNPDMGNSDGWDLLRRLGPLLPVVILSARGLEEDVVAGLDAGAADYVTKPFRSAELVARIRARVRPNSHTASTHTTAHLALPETPTSVPEQAPAKTKKVTRRATRPSSRLGEADEDAVFMSLSEEQRILDAEERDVSDGTRPEDLAHLPLGERLRAARQRKRITLVQAELETKLRMHYIQAMEEEKFSLLPRSALAEELLRTYVAYLGLDMGPALDEYRHLHYSAPIEPPNALGGLPVARRVPRGLIWAAAIGLALLIGIGGIGLADPSFFPSLGARARELVVPPTATATPTPSSTPTATPSPSATPTASPTTTPSATPRPSPTATVEASITPTP